MIFAAFFLQLEHAYLGVKHQEPAGITDIFEDMVYFDNI